MIGSPQRATPAWIPSAITLAAASLLLSGCVVVHEFDSERSNIISDEGFSLVKQEDYEGAKPYFLKALDIDPNNQVARVDLGLCYQKLGEPDAARKQYLEVIEYERNDTRPHNVPDSEGVDTTPAMIAKSNLQFLDRGGASKVIPLIPGSSRPSSATTHD